MFYKRNIRWCWLFAVRFGWAERFCLAISSGQHPQSWHAALLNALVTTYKRHHRNGRAKVRPFVFSFTTRGLAEKRLLAVTTSTANDRIFRVFAANENTPSMFGGLTDSQARQAANTPQCPANVHFPASFRQKTRQLLTSINPGFAQFIPHLREMSVGVCGFEL